MHNSAGQDRRTRQTDLHVLYHDVVVHFGCGCGVGNVVFAM